MDFSLISTQSESCRLLSASLVEYDMKLSESVSSSAPSSPQLSPSEYLYSPSYLSTSSSDVSPGEAQKLDQEDLIFPDYIHREPYDTVKLSELVPSIETILSEELNVLDSAAIPSLLPSLVYPDILAGRPRIRDDILIMNEPSTQVDYLAHNWKEPDIWLTWRHIRSLRVPSSQKTDGYNTRLGNACWRSWAKLKNKLKTCSAETLNWEKDDDITWLYGPIQTKTAGPITSNPDLPVSKLLGSSNGSKRVSILKMRSLSEVMLRHSIDLMQQAIASLHAQESQKSVGHDSIPFRGMYSNYITPWGKGKDPLTTVHASSSSENAIHNSKRRIRFDDKVAQCVATRRETCCNNATDSNDPVDDKFSTLLTTEGRDQWISDGGKPMIEELADKSNTAVHHTHQPPTSPKHVQMPEYEDEDEEDIHMGWLPSILSPASVRQNRVTAYRYRTSDSAPDDDLDNVTAVAARETVRMRLTQPSAQPPEMWMPHWDGEGKGVEDEVWGSMGLYGRVVDAVSTARDIAVVLWTGGSSS